MIDTRNKRLAPKLLWAAGLATIAACHSMRTIQPTQLLSKSVDRVWVTGTDQSTVILHAPHVAGDTLAGFVDGTYRELLLSQTQSIKAKTAAPARTAAIGVVAGVTALTAFIYMANRAYVGDGQTCYTAKDGTVVPCCAGKSTLAC